LFFKPFRLGISGVIYLGYCKYVLLGHHNIRLVIKPEGLEQEKPKAKPVGYNASESQPKG